MSSFHDWYASEPMASFVKRWKRGLGYEDLERAVERTETFEETLDRMKRNETRSSRTYSLDPAMIVSSVLAHAYEDHQRGAKTLEALDELTRAANALAVERYDGRVGAITDVLDSYEAYLLQPGARSITTRIAFDPIGFAASAPERTHETAQRLRDPDSMTLVPLGSGAILAGYDLACGLGLRAEQIEPVHFSRYKSNMRTPHLLPGQVERLRTASRIVVFDEDTETGRTLTIAARHLGAYPPVERATNSASQTGATRG